MTQRMEITLRFTVAIDGHRYRPTQAEIAENLLEQARYDLEGWGDEVNVEKGTYGPGRHDWEPNDWRGYDWSVSAVVIDDPSAEFEPCAVCGHPIDQRPGSGRQRRYCTDACRQYAYRHRLGRL